MANIDVLLKSPTANHKWLSAGKSFFEWVSLWQEDVMKTMTVNKDPVEMYRAQGRLEVLNRIAGLKMEIEQYQKGLMGGKFKKV